VGPQYFAFGRKRACVSSGAISSGRVPKRPKPCRFSQDLEDPRGIAWTLDVFAGLLAAGGCADAAARLWGAADGLLESVSGALDTRLLHGSAIVTWSP